MSLSLAETEAQARSLLAAGQLEAAEALVRPWLASGSGMDELLLPPEKLIGLTMNGSTLVAPQRGLQRFGDS